MALMPKRVKHRKSQRGRIKGNATRGNKVVFGDFGLQCLQGGWIRAQTIEAGRIAELVLWSGDPLDVSSLPLRVIAGGRDWPIDSRQIQLRNRYLERVRSGAAR